MDHDLLVESARRVVKSLQAEGVAISAALLAPEPDDTGGDSWLLWLAPANFAGRQAFYTTLAHALTKHRVIAYFDTSNIRALDPGSSIAFGLKRFGKIDLDHPQFLRSENLPGLYVREGVILLQAA